MSPSSEIEVAMRRGSLEGLPAASLPSGFVIRWYEQGDDRIWHEIQAGTGIYDPIPVDLFDREFGEHMDMLPDRQCFIFDAQVRPVGTATAWFAAVDDDLGCGRVHWVAVVPDMQRRGLGTYLTSAACERLKKLGHAAVYLTTGSKNLAAIQLYLTMGFCPHPRSKEELYAWQRVRGQVQPHLRDRWRALLSGTAHN